MTEERAFVMGNRGQNIHKGMLMMGDGRWNICEGMFMRSDLQGHHSFVDVPHCYFWLCAGTIPFFQTACLGFDVMHEISKVGNSLKQT